MSDVRGFAVDVRGRVYVLDAAEQRVYMFDSSGALLKSIGRRGQGPGEFQLANGIAAWRDQLWVYDPGNNRITVFAGQGQLEATYPLRISSHGYSWIGGIDTSGSLFDEQLIRTETGESLALRRTDFRSGAVDTVPWPECGAGLVPRFTFPRGTMRVPYASGRYSQFDPRGFVWCADTRRFAPKRFALRGAAPLDSIVAAFIPALVTSEERRQAEKEAKEFARVAGPVDLDLGQIPRTKPIVQRLDIDVDGWLVALIETERGRSVVECDATGTPIREGLLPSDVVPVPWLPVVRRDERLYVVAADSHDVPWILELRWP